MRAIVCAVLVLFALSGCSASHTVDEAQWQQDVVTQLGHEPVNWSRLRDLWLDACDGDEFEFGAFITDALDGQAAPEYLRLNVRHVCPDRSEELDEVLDVLPGGS